MFHSDEDHKSDVFQGRERVDSVASIARIRTVSTFTTISHATLPMARDMRGEMVVGRPEPDDDRDSARTSPEDWV